DKSYAIGSVSMAKVCRKLTNKCSSKFDPESSNSTNNSDTTKGVVTSSSTQASSIDDNSNNANSTTTTTTKATTMTTANVNKSCSISYADRKIGDVNCDGKVDDTDAAMILQHCRFKTIKITNEETLSVMDTNQDGKIDDTDAAGVLQFARFKTISRICNSKGKCYSR
ncbi:MAG: dockerin type I repeat-containing protein, partial [Tenericutes bacterium]|nr:dockerin type I repeat-containing protein [Mycoplasmatota bacterium]